MSVQHGAVKLLRFPNYTANDESEAKFKSFNEVHPGRRMQA